MIKRTLPHNAFYIAEVCWYAGHAYLQQNVETGMKGSLLKFIFSHVGGWLFWKTYVTCRLQAFNNCDALVQGWPSSSESLMWFHMKKQLIAFSQALL